MLIADADGLATGSPGGDGPDPRVWCDCFRGTLALSRKNNGGVCAVCREAAARAAYLDGQFAMQDRKAVAA